MLGLVEEGNKRNQPATAPTGLVVADVMSRPQPIVPSHLSMAAARKIAQLKSADSLIVEDKGRLLGVLDRDTLRRAGDDQRVGQCLKPLWACLSPTTFVREARALLIKHGVGSLPVAAGPFLVGSLSRAAVERALAAEELALPSARLAA